MADRSLIEPIKVEFQGRDADAHRMDALLLGQSLGGIAKIYNSVGHFHFHQQIRTSAHSQIRVQVGPPAEGSIFYLIYMMLIHGKLAVYPELLFSLGEFAVPAFIRAMIAHNTGRRHEVEKALEIIQQQSVQHHELAMLTKQSDTKLQEGLMDVVKVLATNNRSAMAEMAAPIGRTVNEIRHVPRAAEPIVIDQADGESLRSKQEVVVGETGKFRGVFKAVDTKSGAFRFEEVDTGVELRGKITDPALEQPQNFYTHALDTQQPVTIAGKPTVQSDGSIHRLFVSDFVRE